MTGMPEDIMKAAFDWAAKCYNPNTGTWLDVRDIFAAAILAERERCAKIASNEADRICENADDYSGPRVHDMLVTSRRIQFAISGEPNIHLSDEMRARLLSM